MPVQLTQDIEDLFQEALGKGGELMADALYRLGSGDDDSADVLLDYAEQRGVETRRLFNALADAQIKEIERQDEQQRAYREQLSAALQTQAVMKKVATGDIPVC